MRQHCFNAKRIAEFLANDPRVKHVFYPGLEEHPGHELAKRQMNDFGGIITFELQGDLGTTKDFISELKLFALAVSLGAVESLIAHPPTMTHATLSMAERQRIGIKDNMVRLSVGIETVEDLIDDLDQALTKAVGHRR
jgi:cystathionine beta-lyase/cystathionine gamma-synthase